MKLMFSSFLACALCTCAAQTQELVSFSYEYNIAGFTIPALLTYLPGDQEVEYIEVTQASQRTSPEGYEFKIPYSYLLWRTSLRDSMATEIRSIDHKGRKNISCTYPSGIKWQILGEEKVVGSTTLLKATTEALPRASLHQGTATAWFDPAIPFPAGPGRYWGLPGLIVELTFSETGESYSLVNTDHSALRDTPPPSQTVEVPYEVILDPLAFSPGRLD